MVGGAGVPRPTLFDAAFVEVDEVGDADDFVGAVFAAHGGEGFANEFAAGVRHALLSQLAVPFGGADVVGEQVFQLFVGFGRGSRFVDDFFDRVGIDAEVEAKEAVDAAFVVFRVARRERAVLFYVTAFREEAREVEQAGGVMGFVG